MARTGAERVADHRRRQAETIAVLSAEVAVLRARLAVLEGRAPGGLDAAVAAADLSRPGTAAPRAAVPAAAVSRQRQAAGAGRMRTVVPREAVTACPHPGGRVIRGLCGACGTGGL